MHCEPRAPQTADESPIEVGGAKATTGSASSAPTHAAVAYGPHPTNVLDFWQAKGNGARPLVVFIHGGGWTRGDRHEPYERIRPYLDKGISYASLDYRLTPEHPLPAPVHDAARAVQFLRAMAEEWGIDKTRLGLLGNSAGGCSALWLLLHDDLADPKSDDPVARESTRVSAASVAIAQTSIDPKVVEAWLGPKVLEHRMFHMSVGEASIQAALENYEKHAELYREFSPINHLSADDPPLLLTYRHDEDLPCAERDRCVHHPEFGKRLKDKADGLGHSTSVIMVKQGHSLEIAKRREFLTERLLAQ